MTPICEFHNVTYTYPDAAAPVLREVNLVLPADGLTLVAGPSGAGKSTLLRCLNGLVPHFTGGRLEGRIVVAGHDPTLATPGAMSRCVGFVFQNPEAQFVTERVEDEVAFALENAALPRAEIAVRVAEALESLELMPLRHRRICTLSGGEKQRVAIAAALALRPRILVLDEPTSQLDPDGAREVFHALQRLTALGLTVIVAEHRLERVLPFARRIVHIPHRGGKVRIGTVDEILPTLPVVPPVVRLARTMGWQPLPRTVEEARPFVEGLTIPPERKLSAASTPALPPVVVVQDIEVFYDDVSALRGVDFALHRGEIVALMGRNGAGKTTLLRTIVGLIRPRRGRVWVSGRDVRRLSVAEVCREVGYLPQNPNALLFAETVRDELLVTLHNHSIPPHAAPVAIDTLLARLGLADKADLYPRDLSVGERQRVALGAVMVTRPAVLLLDEPTRGLDAGAKKVLLALLHTWRDEGMAIALATHDVELAAAAADRVVMLEAGRVVAQGNPSEVLVPPSPFAPQMAWLFPRAGWLTVEECWPRLSSPTPWSIIGDVPATKG